jgi:hypothetical protein
MSVRIAPLAPPRNPNQKIPLELIDQILADAAPQTFLPNGGTVHVSVHPDEVRVSHDDELVHSEPRDDATRWQDGAT